MAQDRPQLGGIPLQAGEVASSMGAVRPVVGGVPLRVSEGSSFSGQSILSRQALVERGSGVNPGESLPYGYYPTMHDTRPQGVSEVAVVYAMGAGGYEPFVLPSSTEYLSPFLPHQAGWGRGGVGAGLSMPIIQQGMKAQASEIQAGPFFIDARSLRLTGYYDYVRGDVADTIGDGGFGLGVGLNFQAGLQLSRVTYFAASGTLYYMPLEGRVGLHAAFDAPLRALVEHGFEVGGWDVTIYDYFDVFTPYMALASATDAPDRSGIYTLNSNAVIDRPFDSDDVSYRNVAGARGSAYIARDVRLSLLAEHFNVWDNNFAQVAERDHGRVGLFYDAAAIWFMPYATYDAYAHDGQLDDLIQRVRVGATFPFNKSITAYANAGYLWGFDARDGSYTWNVGVNHRISSLFSQAASAAYDYYIGDLGDEFFGHHYRYSFTCSLTEDVGVTAFTQYSIRDATVELESWLVGLQASVRLDRLTNVVGRVYRLGRGARSSETERWICEGRISRMLTSRTDASLLVRYSKLDAVNEVSSYDETLALLTLSWSL